MSLKRIKELLSDYEDKIGSSTSEIGAAAKAEIAALEVAAIVVARQGIQRTSTRIDHALNNAEALLETIAKEAK